MSWLDEIDGPDDLDAPDPTPRVTYRLGQNPLDRALLWLGVVLLAVSLAADIGQMAIAGALFLAWTFLRRGMEYRVVQAFNRPGRPTGTLDDDGFVG